jgi:CHAT domain-containing protein
LNNLAKIAIETGDWKSAGAYNEEAWALWRDVLHDKPAEVWSIANAGWIAAGNKEFKRSRQLFRSVIRMSRDPEPVVSARSGMAHMFAEAGRDQDAETEYRSMDTLLERQRCELFKDEHKLSYFSSLSDFYQDYVDFLMARGKVAMALEVAESSRARLLADKLRRSHIYRRRTAAEFRQIASEYGSTLLSYWLGRRNSYLWVVTPAGINWFRLPNESELRSQVASYDSLIQTARDPLLSGGSAGRSLYAALIAPALPLLSKTRKVVLAPDGPLYSLNFETLPVPGDKPHYWIEDAIVSVTPSLGLLSTRPTRGTPQKALLMIGNAVSPVEQYPALENAGPEMAAIERNLSSFQRVVLAGSRAQPGAYAQSDPGRFTLIHFVAHAAVNREEPLESAVILSRDGHDDYKLKAKDVVGTALHADLVTVSACRSAGARTYAGEGLVGFSWAFLEAGARNVIAGLWDVNDRSTAQLMADLYAEVARGCSPVDALRSAKLRMVLSTISYRKPYYWGPFQVFTSSPG